VEILTVKNKALLSVNEVNELDEFHSDGDL